MALNQTQLATLKAAILAETDPTLVALRTAGDENGMAGWYNGSSTYVLWKSKVTIEQTGQAFNGAEWAGMTTANHTRLQTVAQYLSAYNPGLADVRTMFNDIWSGAGGANTRAALLALWKRIATRAEKLYAAGTGSDATPGTPTFEGNISAQDVSDALRA